MAYGYEKGFTIERVHKEKRKLSCSDCDYYDKSDKSCGKTPRYIPVDGYDSWKYCGKFEIDSNAGFRDEKIAQYEAWIRRKNKAKEQGSSSKEKTKVSPKARTTPTGSARILFSSPSVKTKKGLPIAALTKADCDRLTLVVCDTYKGIPKPKLQRMAIVKLASGKTKWIPVYISGNNLYYNKKSSGPEVLLAFQNAMKR